MRPRQLRAICLCLHARQRVVGRLRAGVGAQQVGGALERDIGVGQRRLASVAQGDLLVDRRLIGALLDQEQQLVLLDRIAVGELAGEDGLPASREGVDQVQRAGLLLCDSHHSTPPFCVRGSGRWDWSTALPEFNFRLRRIT